MDLILLWKFGTMLKICHNNSLSYKEFQNLLNNTGRNVKAIIYAYKSKKDLVGTEMSGYVEWLPSHSVFICFLLWLCVNFTRCKKFDIKGPECIKY